MFNALHVYTKEKNFMFFFFPQVKASLVLRPQSSFRPITAGIVRLSGFNFK